MEETSLILEFSGGSEFLVGNEKIHKVSVATSSAPLLIRDVFSWMRGTLLKDCDRTELLLEGDSVRPGVLVLVNDTDWELTGNEDTELKNGDKVTFISTLHGG